MIVPDGSDVEAELQDCLTRHKQMVAQHLEANYDRFFTMANALIMSNNYVTKRQSLKMLGEILLDRSNYNIMTRYISSEANLKMMMNFLRDKSRNIQYEAFHVFKVSPDELATPNSRSARLTLTCHRCLWPIPINRLKSWRFSAVIRTSCCPSSRTSITTKMVSRPSVISHYTVLTQTIDEQFNVS